MRAALKYCPQAIVVLAGDYSWSTKVVKCFSQKFPGLLLHLAELSQGMELMPQGDEDIILNHELQAFPLRDIGGMCDLIGVNRDIAVDILPAGCPVDRAQRRQDDLLQKRIGKKLFDTGKILSTKIYSSML